MSTARVKDKEELEKMEWFRFQNESFKRWCAENSGLSFKVLFRYPDGAVRLKGVNFVVSECFLDIWEGGM